MDHAAISLCRENNIAIIVLNIFKEGNITKAVCGRQVGTLICSSRACDKSVRRPASPKKFGKSKK